MAGTFSFIPQPGQSYAASSQPVQPLPSTPYASSEQLAAQSGSAEQRYMLSPFNIGHFRTDPYTGQILFMTPDRWGSYSDAGYGSQLPAPSFSWYSGQPIPYPNNGTTAAPGAETGDAAATQPQQEAPAAREPIAPGSRGELEAAADPFLDKYYKRGHNYIGDVPSGWGVGRDTNRGTGLLHARYLASMKNAVTPRALPPYVDPAPAGFRPTPGAASSGSMQRGPASASVAGQPSSAAWAKLRAEAAKGYY